MFSQNSLNSRIKIAEDKMAASNGWSELMCNDHNDRAVRVDVYDTFILCYKISLKLLLIMSTYKL